MALVQVFVSYARRDLKLAQELSVHLAPIADLVDLEMWWDQSVEAGERWALDIDVALDTSEIVVALVSPDSLASPFCRNEIVRAREIAGHQPGGVVIIPVIVRPCAWESSAISDLQTLPGSGRTVVGTRDRDRVWVQVAAAIRDAAQRVEVRHDGSLSLRMLGSGGGVVHIPQAPTTSIGRSPECRIRLPFDPVSRRHCEIVVDDEGLLVRDLGSTNGTYVNGRRIGEARLVAGSRLRIGRLTFAVEGPASPPIDMSARGTTPFLDVSDPPAY